MLSAGGAESITVSAPSLKPYPTVCPYGTSGWRVASKTLGQGFKPSGVGLLLASLDGG